MAQPVRKRRLINRVARVVAKTLLFVILFILVIALLIETPPVQNVLRTQAVNWLEKKLKTKVTVGKVYISLPRKIELGDVYIEDQKKDTLLAGGSLKANINMFALAFGKDLNIRRLQLDNITLKANRLEADSLFNYQFFINAFTTTRTPDPADTTSFWIGIPELELNNVRLVYNDVKSGNDMEVWIDHLDSEIEKYDPAQFIVDVPRLNVDGLNARIYQLKVLSPDDSLTKDIREAKAASELFLDFDDANLKNVNIDYRNDVSSFYTNLAIGSLRVTPDNIDVTNKILELDSFSVSGTTTAIRFGKKETSKIVVEEIKQELESQVKAGWRVKINSLNFSDNRISYDNDNMPETSHGINYSHLGADSLHLLIDNFIFDTDSVGGKIINASFREKSGFELDELSGDLMFTSTNAYVRDLVLKTPGSDLKRFASLEYGSYKALNDSFANVMMEADISSSRVQVKDILAFAPALRNQKAFANPNDIWYINLQGRGTLNSLYIDNLQFEGLSDTKIDVSGTLATSQTAGYTGGNLTVRRLHTNQNDIALFTGRRLSTPQLNLPETYDATGTLSGSINHLTANLNIATNMGSAIVQGKFNNLMNPATANYTAAVRTNSLQLGRILRNNQVGAISANLVISGTGLQGPSMNTKFKGQVYAIRYNNYTYRNIDLSGVVQQNNYNIYADIRDPNIVLSGQFTGDMSSNPSIRFTGTIDSIKTLPLGFTKIPMIARGKVQAYIPVMTARTLEADILVTEALIVANNQRLPLDSIHLIAERDGEQQIIRLSSDVATGEIRGVYWYGELATIFSNSIEPYFSVTPVTPSAVHPYDFSFRFDVGNAPALAALVPGLKTFEPIHIEGTASNTRGLNGVANTAFISFNGNEISGLNMNFETTPAGLRVRADLQHLRNPTMNIYHTTLDATALNNRIDFNLNIDDKTGRDKYILAGLLTQPSRGVYTISLRGDSLVLNYDRWNVSPGNSLTISKDQILANNFTLSRNEQVMSLQTAGENLNVNFTNFQISTITGFMQADSLLANGAMTGIVSFKNILKQPVFTSDLAIRDLSLRGDTLGNASIKVDNIGQRYNTNATITGRGNDISLNGWFAPQGERDVALNLDLNVKQLQLSTLEGAVGGYLKNASGSVNGVVKIAGTLSNPTINGPINFNNASFAISVLGSQFKVDGEKLNITNNGFQFEDFVIRDTANNIMRLNGRINTVDFTEYYFDLDVDADHFKLLSTTKQKNSIYYGDLVVTTELHVDGSSSNPIVDGAMSVNKGTNLYVVIPQRDPGTVQREGVVEFVDMDNPSADTLFRNYDSLNVSKFLGMDITANIEIEKDAIFNIVIDEANGDFINLQGEALLSTGIDPSGKITLVGSYELEKGSYEITFNFLRRRFDIQKGSRIVWLNEPTKATMDVTAVYIANTAPIDLVQDQISASTPAIRNTYLQKLPFEVRLYMTGELMQPKVNFDIVLPLDKNYGVSNDIITQVDSRLAQIRTEPGEINKQVFSLLLLNRFVGQNPFESNSPMFSVSTYARQSVSKLLTEQLNKLAAGLFEGVDLNFDITSAEDYTTGERRSRTDLNIGLSKRLLNERLSVSIGSNFELEGPKHSNQKSSNVLGNLSVTYTLSRDGRYLLRFYRKNEYIGIVDGYIIETGLSFLISVDYDRFREILRSRKQRVENVK